MQPWSTRWGLISVGVLVVLLGTPVWLPSLKSPGPAVDSVSPTDLSGGVRMEFVRIAPGEFLMGAANAADDQKPAHRVRITRAFEMGKYEVTEAQWEAVMGPNPSQFKGADRPVETVSWNDAQEFLNKLNARGDGRRYRLPTEAEWEYAARAGRKTRAAYAAPLDIGWFADNSGRESRDAKLLFDSFAAPDQLQAWNGWLKTNENQTHPVGRKRPNGWGLYDLHGNVLEWCQDWYDAGYYRNSPEQDPAGPATGQAKALRGGAWNSLFEGVLSNNRFRQPPDYRSNSVGFRCLRQ